MGCNQSKINKAVVQDNKQPILNNKERNSSLLPNNTSILQEEEEQQLLGKNNSNRSSSIINVDNNEVAVVGSVRRNTVPSIDKRNNSDVDTTKKQQRHSYASSGGGSSTNSPGYISKTSDVSFNSVNAVQSSPGKANADIDVNDTNKGVKESEVGKGKKKTAWSGKHKLRDTSTSSSTSKQQKDEPSTHSIPPPPPPTLSNIDAAINDPHWIQIYTKLSPSIIDPEDLSTIISSIISSQIDKLSPVEVSFIKRRVKYSLGFVINNEGGSGVDDQGGGLGSSEGNREGKERRKSTLSKVGRKLGLNSSSNNLLPLGSKSSNPVSSDLMHPALDESSDRQKTTKQIYKHEHTLDISTIRKIFESGNDCIKKLKRNVKEELVLFGMENSSASGSGGGSDRLERKNSTGKSSTPRSSPTNNDNQTIAVQPKTTQQVNVDQISQVDIYGSTFLLLLHLSENRWEYITELAKVSAENANLILDVNKLCLLDDMKNGKKEIPPPSLSLNPNITPPNTPYYGISFTSICYLISTSKFGTRLQRLQLLFYMLLPPKVLNNVLKLHPAGNIPTWLLECDTNLIVSYDSLCYYYVYDGVVLPNGDDNDKDVKVNGEDKSRKKKKLCIDAYSSVEVMASLVADSLGSGGKVQQQSANDNEGTTAYGTRQLMISLLEMEDEVVKEDNESSSFKCQEVHAMLQEQATSSGANIHPNLSPSEVHDISKFAELAAALPLTNNTQHSNDTTNTTNNNTTNDRLKW